MGEKESNQRYVKLGVTLFASLAAAIAFFFLFFRVGEIKGFLSMIFSALQPLVIGLVLAYLLSPVQRRLERHMKRFGRFARLFSTMLTIVVAFGVVALFIAIVLPQLVGSVTDLVAKLPGLLEEHTQKLNAYLKSDSEASAAFLQMVESAQDYLANWIKENLLSTVTTLSSKVLSIGSMVVNIGMAIIVCVYLLLDQERYLAQIRKLFYAVSHNSQINEAVMDAVHQADRIFSGFISGKLIDSLIVGVICFIGVTILKIPYALLVSVIVGVTNIIPMFGPIIGAVPSAFLILLVSPVKCVVFVIFIILLQQVDGNIIGPRILGNSTGLSALYVTIAMLLFGKLLGFLGMIIGVPLFATLYYLVKRLAEHSLRKQNLPTETAAYIVQEPEPPQSKDKAEKKERKKAIRS